MHIDAAGRAAIRAGWLVPSRCFGDIVGSTRTFCFCWLSTKRYYPKVHIDSLKSKAIACQTKAYEFKVTLGKLSKKYVEYLCVSCLDISNPHKYRQKRILNADDVFPNGSSYLHATQFE